MILYHNLYLQQIKVLSDLKKKIKDFKMLNFKILNLLRQYLLVLYNPPCDNNSEMKKIFISWKKNWNVFLEIREMNLFDQLKSLI